MLLSPSKTSKYIMTFLFSYLTCFVPTCDPIPLILSLRHQCDVFKYTNSLINILGN